MFRLFPRMLLVAGVGAQCAGPTPLSLNAPNVLSIGDSVSMGPTGYAFYLLDMLQNDSGGSLVGSLQHGGGFGWGGQMANSANGAAKVKACMGNASGTLKPKSWSVITYNAGLHDCGTTTERVLPAAYAANLRAVFETLKPAASSTVFVLTTPYDMLMPIHDINNMSCVLQYNAIAREVAADVGAVVINDLYDYAEAFCQAWPDEPASTGYGGNYTTCGIQTSHTGLHFYTAAPLPSGQQYTALSVAEAVMRLIPEADIRNTSSNGVPQSPSARLEAPRGCGSPPAPLNRSLPNVLIIGDSISEPGSGYGPNVQRILGIPRPDHDHEPGDDHEPVPTGALASVQHNGNTGDTQAGPTTHGVACIGSWVGSEKWDVITMNFGIHDCTPGCDGRPKGKTISKADYVKNLEDIYTVARGSLAKDGKILWVTTTPVSNSAAAPFNASGFDQRECIEEYNAGAAALFATKPDVTIADLNTAVTDVCGKRYGQCNLQLHSNCHFTDAGRQFCAIEVAKNIAPLLGPKWAELAPNPKSVMQTEAIRTLLKTDDVQRHVEDKHRASPWAEVRSF